MKRDELSRLALKLYCIIHIAPLKKPWRTMRTSHKRILALVAPVVLGLAPMIAGATQIKINLTPHVSKSHVLTHTPVGHGLGSIVSVSHPPENNSKDWGSNLQNQVSWNNDEDKDNDKGKDKDKLRSVPEPGPLSLLVLGMLGLGIVARRGRTSIQPTRL